MRMVLSPVKRALRAVPSCVIVNRMEMRSPRRLKCGSPRSACGVEPAAFSLSASTYW